MGTEGTRTPMTGERGTPGQPVPSGFLRLRRVSEVWRHETTGEIVVLGTPDAEDDAHNCDALGCSSVGPHVIARAGRSTKALHDALAAIVDRRDRVCRETGYGRPDGSDGRYATARAALAAARGEVDRA